MEIIQANVHHSVEHRQREIRRLMPEVVCFEPPQKLESSPLRSPTSHRIPEVKSEANMLRSILAAYGCELMAMGLPILPRIDDKASSPTICPWILPDGRCSLQALAKSHGQEKWKYEPLACILGSLRLRKDNNLSQLIVTKKCFLENLILEDRSNNCDSNLEFVKKFWRHDIKACANSIPPRIPGFAAIGIRAITKNNVVWVGTFGDHIVTVKVSLRSDGLLRLSNEEQCLRNLDGGYFPRVLMNNYRGTGTVSLMTEYVARTIPLSVWLQTEPSTKIIIESTKNLLRACHRLEACGLLHQDFCPQNILVEPASGKICVVDCELTQSAEIESQCRGGSIGFAAPEQYLNYLGPGRYKTESFVVGAVLFYAFHPEFFGSGIPFPFPAAEVNRMPGECYAAMWALLGDPLQMFSESTRASASYVLGEWSSLPVYSHTRRSMNSSDAGGPTTFSPTDNLVIKVQPRGLEVYRLGIPTATYRGLIDTRRIAILIGDGIIRIGAANINEASGLIEVKMTVSGQLKPAS